jgi:hypothetical protein
VTGDLGSGGGPVGTSSWFGSSFFLRRVLIRPPDVINMFDDNASGTKEHPSGKMTQTDQK